MSKEIEDIVSVTERIVILYANHSGRESDNRGTFRKDVQDLLTTFESQIRESERGEAIEAIESIEVSCVDDRLLGQTDEYLEGYNDSTKRWRERRDEVLATLTPQPLEDKTNGL